MGRGEPQSFSSYHSSFLESFSSKSKKAKRGTCREVVLEEERERALIRSESLDPHPLFFQKFEKPNKSPLLPQPHQAGFLSFAIPKVLTNLKLYSHFIDKKVEGLGCLLKIKCQI